MVDTGSTDGTPDLARELGARVEAFAWTGSFSAARNHALALARGEWALIMDADEELASGQEDAIAALLADTATDAWVCPVHSFVGEHPGAAAVVDHRVFFLRRRANYRFTGNLHEDVQDAVPPEKVGQAAVLFRHYGHLAAEVQRQGKRQRNLAVLSARLAEHPDDPFLLYCLGTEHLSAGDTAAAEATLAGALAAAPADAYYRPDLYNKLAGCGQARRWLEPAVAEYPEYTDLWYLLAGDYRQCGDHLAAEACLRLCLALGEPPPGYLSLAGVGGHLAWTALGELYLQQGKGGAAQAAFTAALRADPAPGRSLVGWAQAVAATAPEQIQAAAAATFDLAAEPTALAVAQALRAAGTPAGAAAVLRAAAAAGAGPPIYAELAALLQITAAQAAAPEDTPHV